MAMNIQKEVDLFMDLYKNDIYGEVHSYDLVHKRFVDLRYDHAAPTRDYLALNLFTFLASWGMLRGSTFMLRKNYLFLLEIVDLVRQPKYDYLVDIDVFSSVFNRAKYIDDVLELKNEIIRILGGKPYFVLKKDNGVLEVKKKLTSKPSDTLVGKILLVTLGCLFAYDRLAIAACRKEKITAVISQRGLNALLDYMSKNSADIVAAVGNANAVVQSIYGASATYYSQMKIMDMALWA